MKSILSEYTIVEQTKAIIPQNHLHYRSLVLETNGSTFYVEQTPIQIIEANCLDNGCTYEGRRTAVKKRLEFKRKIPIPISRLHSIYTFPTHSTTNPNCIWIFPQHISHMDEQLLENLPSNHTKVTFKDGTILSLDVSYYVMKKQVERTMACRQFFSG